MKGRELKRIWGKPWDFAYLLELEQHKIREMIRYFEKYHHLVDWHLVVRDLKICNNLIDIILEKDKYYLSWLRESYSGNPPYEPVKFPVHVNTRNFKRFMPTVTNLDFVNSRIYSNWCSSYRQKKAMHLYNKIRAYRMFTWWD